MKKFLQKDRQTFVYNPKILSGIIDRMDKHLAGNFDIPYTLVPEDMKDFLKRIPDNSVCVFARAIRNPRTANLTSSFDFIHHA